MASTVKRGEFYSASFIDGDGKRRQVATKEKKRYEAQATADLLELPHQLKKAGSEAPILYALNSLNIQVHSKVCALSESINQLALQKGENITELAEEIEELKEITTLGFEAARYPYVKTLRTVSSFTGMPPEADLEIRTSFKSGKRRGGGDMKLHLAARLLRELTVSGSPLSEEGHKMVWKRAWASLGDAILQNHVLEGIPIHSLIRNAAALIEKRNLEDLEQHPDTNESRVYWYVASCHKVNKTLAPRSAIHRVLQGSGMTKPTINRILGSWERICDRYEKGFEFPRSADGYQDLAEHFTSEEDLKKGRLIYFRV